MIADSSCIVGLGATTALGRDAASSAAAVRAGITGFGEHPFMIDTAGLPMKVARAPWLEIGLTGSARLEFLLLPAIQECLAVLAHEAEALRIALALALPSPRPGLSHDVATHLVEVVKRRLPGTFAAIATFTNGHAAGLLALQAVQRRLKEGSFDACVIAGVDSYLELETLEWLEECDQLHGAGALNNAWGFIPGEGAGAVLLARAPVAERLGLSSIAEVVAVGTALEDKRIKTRTVCLGEGLTAAFRHVLRELVSGEKITDVYCDMNGEPYRADEYGFTCLRTKEFFLTASDFVAPADSWGDVCAASGPLLMSLAVLAGRKRYSKGNLACVWASSEDGSRAAAILRVVARDSDDR
jgi:3-oxoacyl-[acyl-carrier-protein] synthase-1